MFTPDAVANYRDVLKGDAATLKRFNAVLRNSGILKSDSKLYSSLALTDADLAHTLDAFSEAANTIAS